MVKRRRTVQKANKDVKFIKLCTLGVAAIFAITVLIVVISVNLV